MIRYLHGRCLRLESCRKALVWQKRYLQRVLAGYTELEQNLRLPSSRTVEVSTGKKRFKCVAGAVVAVVRMGFLVRRHAQARALSARCVTRRSLHLPSAHTTAPQYSGTSPPTREPATTPRSGAPAQARGGASSLARRVLKQEMRLNLPASPTLGVGNFNPRSPYAASSPREDPFILSSPRGELAAAYLSKLELVSRCLAHATDNARELP